MRVHKPDCPRASVSGLSDGDECGALDRPAWPICQLAVNDTVVSTVRRRLAGRRAPLVVALDGRSGAGKSTVAAVLAREFDAAVLETDDFYAGSASVIVLDGVYSARPELADRVDLAVLVTLPEAMRRERLLAREGKEFMDAWHARWDVAEHHYFTEVRPRESFDLVLDR